MHQQWNVIEVDPRNPDTSVHIIATASERYLASHFLRQAARQFVTDCKFNTVHAELANELKNETPVLKKLPEPEPETKTEAEPEAETKPEVPDAPLKPTPGEPGPVKKQWVSKGVPPIFQSLVDIQTLRSGFFIVRSSDVKSGANQLLRVYRREWTSTGLFTGNYYDLEHVHSFFLQLTKIPLRRTYIEFDDTLPGWTGPVTEWDFLSHEVPTKWFNIVPVQEVESENSKKKTKRTFIV